LGINAWSPARPRFGVMKLLAGTSMPTFSHTRFNTQSCATLNMSHSLTATIARKYRPAIGNPGSVLIYFFARVPDLMQWFSFLRSPIQIYYILDSTVWAF
jgi:hypothetical protein